MLARFKDGKVRKVLQFTEAAGVVCDNGENKYVGSLGIDILYLELEDNESGKELVKEHCWEERRADFAKSAMNAILANREMVAAILQSTNPKEFEYQVARNSVSFADALIAELKKTNEKE